MAIATRKKLINTQMKYQSKSNQLNDSWHIKDKIESVVRGDTKVSKFEVILLVNRIFGSGISNVLNTRRAIVHDLSRK